MTSGSLFKKRRIIIKKEKKDEGSPALFTRFMSVLWANWLLPNFRVRSLCSGEEVLTRQNILGIINKPWKSESLCARGPSAFDFFCRFNRWYFWFGWKKVKVCFNYSSTRRPITSEVGTLLHGSSSSSVPTFDPPLSSCLFLTHPPVELFSFSCVAHNK